MSVLLLALGVVGVGAAFLRGRSRDRIVGPPVISPPPQPPPNIGPPSPPPPHITPARTPAEEPPKRQGGRGVHPQEIGLPPGAWIDALGVVRYLTSSEASTARAVAAAWHDWSAETKGGPSPWSVDVAAAELEELNQDLWPIDKPGIALLIPPGWWLGVRTQTETPAGVPGASKVAGAEIDWSDRIDPMFFSPTAWAWVPMATVYGTTARPASAELVARLRTTARGETIGPPTWIVMEDGWVWYPTASARSGAAPAFLRVVWERYGWGVYRWTGSGLVRA